MAVLDPLKVTITNYEGTEELETAIHPLKPELGTRKLSFWSNVTIRSKLIEIIEIYKRKELYYVKIQI